MEPTDGGPVDESTRSPSAPAPPKWLNLVNKSTKYVVIGTTAAAVLWHRDLNVCWALIGAVLNAFVNKLMKRLLNIERPNTGLHFKTDPGMPSSHAQSLAYLGTYPAATWISAHHLAGAAPAAVIVAGAMSFAWLRVRCGYHTVPQVVVGFVLGTLTATGWRCAGLKALTIVATSPTATFAVYSVTLALSIAFMFMIMKPVKLYAKLMAKRKEHAMRS